MFKHLVKEKGKLRVYVVDGDKVRDDINCEFTNYGQHYRFPFIPTNEIWLDKEYQRNEREPLLAHAIKERSLMRKGVDYDDAYEAGKEEEIKYRSKSCGDVRKRLLYLTDTGLLVWLVNGKKVRDNHTLDFTEGGHGNVYSFIPKNEVWIDDDLSAHERAPVVLHEINEYYLMGGGMKYNPAHIRSRIKEQQFRKKYRGNTRKGINTRIKVM